MNKVSARMARASVRPVGTVNTVRLKAALVSAPNTANVSRRLQRLRRHRHRYLSTLEAGAAAARKDGKELIATSPSNSTAMTDVTTTAMVLSIVKIPTAVNAPIIAKSRRSASRRLNQLTFSSVNNRQPSPPHFTNE